MFDFYSACTVWSRGSTKKGGVRCHVKRTINILIACIFAVDLSLKYHFINRFSFFLASTTILMVGTCICSFHVFVFFSNAKSIIIKSTESEIETNLIKSVKDMNGKSIWKEQNQTKNSRLKWEEKGKFWIHFYFILVKSIRVLPLSS